MLWRRQPIFESKGRWQVVFFCRMQDSNHGSLRHQIASRLNVYTQTDWAIEDQTNKLELNSPSLCWAIKKHIKLFSTIPNVQTNDHLKLGTQKWTDIQETRGWSMAPNTARKNSCKALNIHREYHSWHKNLTHWGFKVISGSIQYLEGTSMCRNIPDRWVVLEIEILSFRKPNLLIQTKWPYSDTFQESE